jgi:hypothetical protein
MASQNQTEHIDISFSYFQEQWTQVRHHESLRSALTLQVLVSLGAIVAGYMPSNGTDRFAFRLMLSVLAVLVGIGGFIAVLKIEQAARIHIRRARAARKALGFLEPFAKRCPYQFPQLRNVYLGLNIVVVGIGVFLFTMAFVLNSK